MATATVSGSKYDARALREKYLAERDKRLRRDGEAQYLEAAGDFADFVEDPYVEPGFTRDAIVEDVDLLIVGGGFGGLLTAAEAVKRGIDSFRIVELAGDFGGTWYWNRYPGVRCDIEAYIYMPLIEEVGTVPTERYAVGGEIFEHARAIGRHFGLYDHALFQTKVERMAWDEAAGRWIVETSRGDTIRARFVSVSQGPLAKVKLPGIPGIREFKGRMFHSARWDYAYTGGDPSGGLTGLAGKTVGIIGTGATAVQIAPKVAPYAKRLYIFQRTPSAVDIRDNSTTDADWLKHQPSGWQRERMENFLAIVSGAHVDRNLVNDRWGDLWMRFGELMQTEFQAGGALTPGDMMQRADYEKMEAIRRRVAETIDDPEQAARLMPWYNFLCKRPLYSDEYLPVFNRPNVSLIDTDGRGVERLTENGLVANDQEFAVDLIIFATGFDVGAPPHKVGEYEVTGRRGITLDDKWRHLRTLHGTQFSGFPNLHVVGGTAQGTTAFNFTHTLLMQAEHAVDIVGWCLAHGVKAMEVTPEAEERWHDLIEAKHVDHQQFYEECTPGFLNNEGNFRDKPTYIGGTYGGGPLEYEQIIREWRRDRIQDDTVVTPLD
ncbi:flavin-containing monooxygenase [Sphingomonas canadensis]|uniref:Flavin-containing monooxygenase n=1 Tax=Sphingomonas canadensis TaxID=1219257 RepID=A0ABW3HF74_9SPHN|nr:NAD(P)/FAD-dependent oxidoreductase [Sphingomonas canadensis]MCW3838125.1 NAD(P)/FAD-dependent oxidoreductase [Sphingomonas canadensis]